MSAVSINHKIILLCGIFIREHMGEMTEREVYQDGGSTSSEILR